MTALRSVGIVSARPRLRCGADSEGEPQGMKAIVNTAPGRLEWKDLAAPEPGPGQVRIRTAVCGICATDLEMIAGWERTAFPAIPGHEWSGIVDCVGEGVDEGLVGKCCVAENVLSTGEEVGFERPGGYCELFVTEGRNVHVLPSGLSADVAALVEPLAVAVRGVWRLGPVDQSRALVFGDGPIGLLCVLLLHRQGIGEIGLIGGRELRLRTGRKFGAASVLNYHDTEDDLDEAAARLLGGDVPNVVEASGSAQAMEAALEVAGPQGKILVIGEYGAARAGFAWNDLLRELELIGSNASAGAWPEAVRLASEEQEALEKLITHRLPARDFARGMELMSDRNEEVIKVVLGW